MGTPTTTQPTQPTQPIQNAMPAGVIPISTADGKPITIKVKGPKGQMIDVTVAGYNPTTGTYYLANGKTDTAAQAQFPNNPSKLQGMRAADPTLNGACTYLANQGYNTLPVQGRKGLNATQAAAEIQNLAKDGKLKAPYMHIVQAQTDQAEAKKKDGKWYDWFLEDTLGIPNWLWTLAVVGVLGYFGFRKGGWFNKDKKRSTLSSVTPSIPGLPDTPTGGGITTDIPTYTPPTSTPPSQTIIGDTGIGTNITNQGDSGIAYIPGLTRPGGNGLA